VASGSAGIDAVKSDFWILIPVNPCSWRISMYNALKFMDERSTAVFRIPRSFRESPSSASMPDSLEHGNRADETKAMESEYGPLVCEDRSRSRRIFDGLQHF
jgi:hypothetical protein